MALVIPNLDGLQGDAQDVVCKHLTYGEVDAQHDVDAFPDDLPDVHLDVLDVVNDVLAEFSKMSLWMLYLNSSMLSALLYLNFSSSFVGR